MNYQIIILAAGQGTRMNGNDLPKVVYRINDRPMIQYLLDQVKKLGNQETPVLVVGYKYDLVQKELGNDYIYAFQEGQKGTGHAVAAAQSKVTAVNTLVLYGDHPFIKAGSIQKIIEAHSRNNSTITMFTTKVVNFDGLFSGFLGFGRIIRYVGSNSFSKNSASSAPTRKVIIVPTLPKIASRTMVSLS